MPLFCTDIASEARYFARKEAIVAEVATRFRDAPLALDWRLNNLDAPGRGAGGAYLTVTGTSAEDADSGQVGRGNRVGGLIAHARPTSGGDQRQTADFVGSMVIGFVGSLVFVLACWLGFRHEWGFVRTLVVGVAGWGLIASVPRWAGYLSR